MIPEAAVEALARVLADSALFDADREGYGWDAEKDSSDHFMPTARKKARRYLEAAAPHIRAQVLEEAADAWQVRMDTIGRGSADAKLFMQQRAATERVAK